MTLVKQSCSNKIMSKIDEYIAKRSKQSSDFARKYNEENQKLQLSIGSG